MTAPQSAAPTFSDLLAVADDMAASHGIAPEAVLLQMLALGSALAGDLITSKHASGPAIPAKFSLLIRTVDPELPAWIGGEWAHLASRQGEVLNAPPSPIYGTNKAGALRRRQRVLKHLNPGSSEDASMIDSYLECLKNRKSFRFLHIVGKGPCPVIQKAGRSVTLAAGGFKALRKILMSRNIQTGPWELLNNAAGRSNLLGWIDRQRWKELVREADGAGDLSKLGFIIDCPASAFNPEIHEAPKVTAAAMVRRLEIARFGGVRFCFEPPDEAVALLDRQAGQTEELLGGLPGSQREFALPDPKLAWHLSAILAALCAGGQGIDAKVTACEATLLGVALASWAVRQHLYHFRQTFPADDQGHFEGRDLRILRFLTASPGHVRLIQRRLKGVPKEFCLLSVRRAVAAGLAVEHERERFTALPPPGLGLSDFIMDFSPSPALSAVAPPDSSDIPDKPPPAPRGGDAPDSLSKENTSIPQNHTNP